MSLKTLISAAVLLGSSTAALAQPTSWSSSRSWSASRSWSQPSPLVRDHRPDRWAPAPTPAPGSWYAPDVRGRDVEANDFDDDDELPAPVDYGNVHTIATFDRAFDTRYGAPITIDVGAYGIPSRKLVVKSTGDSEIYNLVVYYADGTSHTYAWNHLFNAPTSDGQAGSQLVMGGTGKAITRIVLNGYNTWNTRMSVQIQS